MPKNTPTPGGSLQKIEDDFHRSTCSACQNNTPTASCPPRK